jgi:hypothetical protein
VRVAPHADLGSPPKLPNSSARCRPARFEALLPPGIRTPRPRARETCAPLAHDRLGRCSRGIPAPTELSPPRPRVRSTAVDARRLSRTPPEDHTPFMRTEHDASILRPRFSVTGGGDGWPPVHSTGGRCARPRPLTAGTPSSLVLCRPRAGVSRVRRRRDSRGLKGVVVSRSRVETDQLSWGLPPLRQLLPVRRSARRLAYRTVPTNPLRGQPSRGPLRLGHDAPVTRNAATLFAPFARPRPFDPCEPPDPSGPSLRRPSRFVSYLTSNISHLLREQSKRSSFTIFFQREWLFDCCIVLWLQD